MAICPAKPLNYNIQNSYKSTEDPRQSSTNITKSNDTQNFYFNKKKTHLDKKDFDMIELSNLGKSYSYEESESDENIDQSTESDSLKESYFLQKVKYDEIDDQETLLYPDIHHTIFSFIDPNDYENISQVNKVARKFISSNFKYKNCSKKLKSADDVDKLTIFLKDENNNQFLKSIKRLSLDIDVYNGGIKSKFNYVISVFTSPAATQKSQFEQLIDQLKLVPIKNLKLTIRNINLTDLIYLANSELSLSKLDLSSNDIEVSDVTEIIKGNLNLEVLVLNIKDKDAALYVKQNSKIRLYLSCTFSNGPKYVGEWKDGKFCGHGKLIWADGISKYVGEWQDDKRHGVGKRICFDGNTYETYEGVWVNDKRHGYGVSTSYNTYRGEWVNDKKHGFGKCIYSGGSSYEGYWANGKKHGIGTFTDSNGNTYDEEWVNGKKIKSQKA